MSGVRGFPPVSMLCDYKACGREATGVSRGEGYSLRFLACMRWEDGIRQNPYWVTSSRKPANQVSSGA